MFKAFIPEKLIEAQRKIAEVHSNKLTVRIIPKDDKLRKLIEYLTAIDPMAIGSAALSLTEEDVAAVSGYIPHNYWDVDMQNLFEIMRSRADVPHYEILFRNWLDAYERNVCNDFLSEQLLSGPFWQVLGKNHLTDIFRKVLAQPENVLRVFGSCIGKADNSKKWKYTVDVKYRLEYYGIADGSKLFHDLEKRFYLYCNKEDYLNSDVNRMHAVIKEYEKTDLRQFISNFIVLLNLQELLNFQVISKYLLTRIGEKGSPAFISFFSGIPAGLVDKYIDWTNMCKVRDYFGTDERSQFWVQYRFQNVTKFSASNSIVMELNGCYVSEFLGTASGPIYFYDKARFDAEVRRRFEKYDNRLVRSWLFENHQTVSIFRKAHQGNWEQAIHNYLIGHRYTEYVLQKQRERYGL